jgi:ArsR family transcriptional regulator
MKKQGVAECVHKRDIADLYDVIKVLCDMNRLKIICLLFEGEKCVCDIEHQLLISQPLASHHLGVLRESGLVEVRREATWSYYSLNRESIENLNHLFAQVLSQERFPEGYPQREGCSEPIEKAHAGG